MAEAVALRVFFMIGCCLLLVWGVMSIVYSVIGSVVYFDGQASGVANPIGLAAGVTEIVMFIFGMWGGGRIASFPLILFAVLSVLLLGLNIAALTLYLLQFPRRFFIVLDFIWYILAIAFLLLLFIMSLVISRRSRRIL
jgi:hypothetical protein